MIRSRLAAVLAGLTLAAAAPAATLLHSTYSGTIASGTDGAGLFGAVGTNLAGLAYTQTMTHQVDGYYADPTPGDEYYDNKEEDPDQYSAFEITVNAKTFAFVGINGSERLKEVSADHTYFETDLEGAHGDATYIINYPVANSGYVVPYDGVATLDGFFSWNVAGIGKTLLNFTPATRAVAHVTVEITDVPEPASWALLVAGFGLVGAALRRRRSLAAGAAVPLPLTRARLSCDSQR